MRSHQLIGLGLWATLREWPRYSIGRLKLPHFEGRCTFREIIGGGMKEIEQWEER
ncbi:MULTISPECIES: hypothetical protein [Moorena]|uniref:hypothetical protein n=1 Tax=Moorena TaxID=1155738 RepID=UPI0012B5E498|nr:MULTISPECIES: hypothetical protein [Moorena]NEQ14588.1 hypothetical protein [Moorena sp. SIO3E2]NEP33713.1 hypothetical protein [Moorena sp. SIO3B2]NEP70279.1 hypothetical protein [Moorena sp. SIO3A5]NER91135.1 hypothetical protein [Moorena sp. SIO3A2]NES45706.1 hypothetical protein [Moorena sp. SIO2C4]